MRSPNAGTSSRNSASCFGIWSLLADRQGRNRPMENPLSDRVLFRSIMVLRAALSDDFHSGSLGTRGCLFVSQPLGCLSLFGSRPMSECSNLRPSNLYLELLQSF